MTATIIEGDCLDVMRGMADCSIDFSLFSPPYDQTRDYQGYPPLDMRTVGETLYRVIRDGGMCAVIIQDGTKDFAKSLTTFRLAVDWADTVGWRLFECCIYQRGGTPGGWWQKRFRVDHEYILLFLKGSRPAYFEKAHLSIPMKHPGVTWHGTYRKSDGTMRESASECRSNETKCRGTVWSYATSNTEGNRLKLQHPATMPDRLASDLIQTFCPIGGLVLDPMCGSGTTVVAAMETGRRATGIEVSAEYCAIARARLADAAAQSRLELTA